LCILFVVPPLVGHIVPTVALGQELADRGHQVAWAGDAETVGRLLSPGATLLPVAADFGGQTLAQVRHRSLGLRGAAAFRFLWADFLIPLAVSMVPGVAAAVDVTLLGRFYERFADHAVEVARRVIFQATGRFPEDEAVAKSG